MEILQYFFDPNRPFFGELVAIALISFGLLVLKGIKAKLMAQTDFSIIDAALSSVYRPAKTFLLLTLVWYVITLLNITWALNLSLEQYPVVQLLVAVHLSWYGFKVVSTYEKQALSKTTTGKLDQTAIIGLAKISRLVLTVILTIVAFDLLGLDASGLIALGGVSGAALAFASKDLVANWFGGIMLYLDKPFKVGDWIRSPDREIEGTVEYIGWRITKIRTFDKRPLYVPNSLFNSITVQNPSRMTHRRIQETISVRYDDVGEVKALVEDIKAYLQGSDIVAQDQVQIVNLNGFGASSLDILVYCMTITTDWVTFHQHKQRVMLDIADLVAARGAEFAFPTQTLHLQQQQSGDQ